MLYAIVHGFRKTLQAEPGCQIGESSRDYTCVCACVHACKHTSTRKSTRMHELRYLAYDSEHARTHARVAFAIPAWRAPYMPQ